ncbi:hypothetical protein, partial [Candidatus Avelusimicrobium fimicolum]
NNLDWIPIGPDFPPTKAKNVEIIGSKSDITRPYGNLGLLRIKNLQPTRDNLKMGVEKGRKFVASKGADAMLIGQYNSAEDGASNPRVTLIIYAIKYVDNLSEEDEKAIEDFKVLGILNERSDS